MRYLGGLLGGSWLTAMTGDLGAGKFDGAWLVSNFESGNPANTYWTKQYEVWADVDRAADRYLGFEKWWGGHVTMNAAEMQFIVDQLFIGNRLATGELTFADGTRVDLRNIASPIIVFCSEGDDITPPAQALSWVSDLYKDIDDLRTHGQTIVYSVHGSIGHLGIFVSGGVARKEHNEFASNMDMIDVLPPGLYEAVLQESKGMAREELAGGDWLAGFEARDMRDLAAHGGTSPEDEKRFAAARRVSEANLALYRMARPARAARRRHAAGGGDAGPAASRAAVLHAVLRSQPMDGLGAHDGRDGPRPAPARAARQSRPGRREGGVGRYRAGADRLWPAARRGHRAAVPGDLRCARDAGADRRRGGRRAAAAASRRDAGPPPVRRPCHRAPARPHGRGRAA